MKVIRENSKAIFKDLARGDKYAGPVTGQLCVKTDNTHGVNLVNHKVGYVAPETVVGLPVKRGKIVLFKDVKPGKTFIRQGVADKDAFVMVKISTTYGSASSFGVRVCNGAQVSVGAYEQVELLDGTYTFRGA